MVSHHQERALRLALHWSVMVEHIVSCPEIGVASMRTKVVLSFFENRRFAHTDNEAISFIYCNQEHI
jgi:hypothetical protein